ncbi:hypothetical protein BE21_57580 [Sorangium cellulosum]|uniref:Secreted protein n=1 Tax=Sorangium cellulosum TaxID=56 RepID=A0A150U3L3_SORCE|nr:hypothetical protein BE21_57580 [Sorangium cellulosum]
MSRHAAALLLLLSLLPGCAGFLGEGAPPIGPDEAVAASVVAGYPAGSYACLGLSSEPVAGQACLDSVRRAFDVALQFLDNSLDQRVSAPE